MQVIADLQLHSKYARAVSPQMMIPFIGLWAKIKGIGLIATGDWTHPLWMREIKANLTEDGSGLLRLKKNEERFDDESPMFLLESEVSCIYTQGGKGRRVHTLIWSPTIDTCDKINKELTRRGANLLSDGRPIIGLTSIQVAEVVFSIDPKCLIVPAHVWTPWFSLYGSKSGFDSISDCYGSYAKDIFAVETGLSSDPSMNWRIKELDNRSIVSFSDAHSGPKLGREATVFELQELSYQAIREAITQSVTTNFSDSTVKIGSQTPRHSNTSSSQVAISADSKIVVGRPRSAISYTLEFYPEEGKYHYTGHRACGVKQDPRETGEKGTVCPVCGRPLTIGVMHRVEELAGRSEADLKLTTKEVPGTKVKGIYSEAFSYRPPYIKLVPLQEIIAETIGGAPTAVNVQNEYKKLTNQFSNEFAVLLQTNVADIAKVSGEKVAQAIHKVREGDIVIDPGYDGVFGVVKIWGEDVKKKQAEDKKQLSLL
ncbi:DNA helicase UvrD [Candidatus Gottesmanbacteria bacterium]|nr:DNA helicase UvrD [Candidatus Gottesmanbacteria bacterium]